jgi:hypothetical protein
MTREMGRHLTMISRVKACNAPGDRMLFVARSHSSPAVILCQLPFSFVTP